MRILRSLGRFARSSLEESLLLTGIDAWPKKDVDNISTVHSR
jgi:hypothetical protein